MKKCAKCDLVYEDAYDGCPRCARAGAPPPPISTTRCPACGKDYDASYAHCPTCAAAAALRPKSASKKQGFVAFLVLLLFVGWALSNCHGSGASATDSPAVAAAAQSAASPVLASLAGPLGREPIRSVSADSAGLVTVHLNFTKAFYEGDSGIGQAGLSDLAAAIATPIFDAVPQAQEVNVLDSDGAMFDDLKRSDRK